MSQHTMVNLREVEDMAPKFGYAPTWSRASRAKHWSSRNQV